MKTNREIKSLNYKLMRVVTSDDIHTVIHPFRPCDLEVIEQTLILAKVHVKGNMSPAKFSVVCKNQENKVDLKVYMSTYFKEPDEKHFEKMVTNVSITELIRSYIEKQVHLLHLRETQLVHLVRLLVPVFPVIDWLFHHGVSAVPPGPPQRLKERGAPGRVHEPEHAARHGQTATRPEGDGGVVDGRVSGVCFEAVAHGQLVAIGRLRAQEQVDAAAVEGSDGAVEDVAGTAEEAAVGEGAQEEEAVHDAQVGDREGQEAGAQAGGRGQGETERVDKGVGTDQTGTQCDQRGVEGVRHEEGRGRETREDG